MLLLSMLMNVVVECHSNLSTVIASLPGYDLGDNRYLCGLTSATEYAVRRQ